MEAFLKTLQDVKLVTESAIVLCERPGHGVDKKQEVLSVVHEFMELNGLKMPISTELFDLVVGSTIDWFVKWLNDTVWKKDEKK